VQRDRYQNYWVCGLYRKGDERRAESYVVSLQEIATANYPRHLVEHAIKAVDDALARWINQPLYL
jgi:hypothetical protein